MQREKASTVICKSCHNPINDEFIKTCRDSHLDRFPCPFCGTEIHLDQNGEDAGNFDVFLCYNWNDKVAVGEIGELLKQHKLLPWFDEWELPPGAPWQTTIMNQIKRVKSVAIFVGKDGIGPWENLEIRQFLREFVKKGAPVIPVLLEDAPDEPRLPNFLMGRKWVHLREADAIEYLIWGITGRRYKN